MRAPGQGQHVLSEAARSDIRALRARYPVAQSALIPALLRAQDELGWVPPGAMAEVAELLDLPVEVAAEVASFYSLIFTEPVGRHVVQLCTNVSCLLCGADDRIHRGLRPGQTKVVGDRAAKESGSLRHPGQLRAPRVRVDLLQRPAIDRDLPGLSLQEA